MATRWWHHDDRDGLPARTGYDTSANSSYRQPAPQQQYQAQTQMRPEAAEFKPQPQASQQAAPGFNRAAGPAVAKAQLPKCWEYEDPLKDVHGPFDAAQIINWFAQDWFGTDLKIRRIGQYWTMLEYVLEELKAEARGTAAPSAGYTTAPQQLPQAATTPANSFGGQRSPAAPAATTTYGRPAAAAPAATGADSWAPGGSNYTATAPEDSWGPGGASGRPDQMDRGYGSSGPAAAAASAQTRPRGRGAAAADEYISGSGGFGSEDYTNVRGRGARDKEREAAGAGVQFGTDGKWERGHVIGDSRRGPGRGSRGYQDYDSYGDEYGGSSRESRRGRGRGGRGDRGDRGGGYGDDRETSGYERASKILEGADDEEYGTSGRPRGRVARESRGPSTAAAASSSGREQRQEPAAAAAAAATASTAKVAAGTGSAKDRGASPPSKPRSRREGKASKEATRDAAAAVAAATAGLSSMVLSAAPAAAASEGSSTAAAPPADASSNKDSSGGLPPAVDTAAVAADDGWSNSKPTVLGKWGDEPLDSDSPTADEQAAGPPTIPPAAAAAADVPEPEPEKQQGQQQQQQQQQEGTAGPAADTDGSRSAEATSTDSAQPVTEASAGREDDSAGDKLAAKPAAVAEQHQAEGAIDSHAAPTAAADVSSSKTPAGKQAETEISKPQADAAAGGSEEKPKLSKVQQLIKLQEQLQQQEAGKVGKLSPSRNATPPRTPLKNSASTGSLADKADSAGSPKASKGGAGDMPEAKALAGDDVPAKQAAPGTDEPKAEPAEVPAQSSAAEPAAEGGVKTVAGITAGIFSRVAGALMGGGGSSAAEGKAAMDAEGDLAGKAEAAPAADE